MGVFRSLTLEEAQTLFPTFHIKSLHPTADGVIDTTYISDNYILKYYEREIIHEIILDTQRLDMMREAGLSVTECKAQKDGWYLYTKLKGNHLNQIQSSHIRSLAHFVAKMHKLSLSYTHYFMSQYDTKVLLNKLKPLNFYYYKKSQHLENYKQRCQGFIHGDIFVDNALFEKEHLSLFDFIDGGCGSFAFELAVIDIAFNPHKKLVLTKLLVQSYNQHTSKKITFKEFYEEREKASTLYALLRVQRDGNLKRAKELL
jgi:homoserine kinase type II